eukprot:CAMPEP_0202906262 /NCGR_PEP_ID=MMETSP1392-20130828/37984_1 /ASSEMBLY_ACC=CAM_ASM_000868 /TAXON_ID=225041 /ORGANISM="Chlamydomonas chlamydogama, Strain SAG 11-48b" /LENGTH=152 /DNA_ID=CAMNT_0049594677 /DNA_START=112 /DNA_END=569 /DNA_ORIENTATION=+
MTLHVSASPLMPAVSVNGNLRDLLTIWFFLRNLSLMLTWSCSLTHARPLLVSIGLQAERFQNWLSGWYGLKNPGWESALEAYFAALQEHIDPVKDMISLGLTKEAAQWASTVKDYGHREPADWANIKVQAELGLAFRDMFNMQLNRSVMHTL